MALYIYRGHLATQPQKQAELQKKQTSIVGRLTCTFYPHLHLAGRNKVKGLHRCTQDIPVLRVSKKSQSLRHNHLRTNRSMAPMAGNLVSHPDT